MKSRFIAPSCRALERHFDKFSNYVIRERIARAVAGSIRRIGGQGLLDRALNGLRLAIEFKRWTRKQLPQKEPVEALPLGMDVAEKTVGLYVTESEMIYLTEEEIAAWERTLAGIAKNLDSKQPVMRAIQQVMNDRARGYTQVATLFCMLWIIIAGALVGYGWCKTLGIFFQLILSIGAEIINRREAAQGRDDDSAPGC